MPLTLPKIEMPSWLKLPALGGSGGGAASSRLLAPRIPEIAFDVDHRSIAKVRIGRRKQERFIASWEVVELPPEVVSLDFNGVRLTDPGRLTELIRGLIAREEVKVQEASVLLPDSYARVAILSLDRLPRKRSEALDIIRWKTKKAVPFKVDQAAVDYMVLPGRGPGIDVLAVLTPRQVVEAFEATFGSLEIHTGLVDLNTLSLLNLYRPVFEKEIINGSEFMVANVSDGFVTFVVFRGQQMIFFRSKPFLLESGAGDLAEGEAALKLIRRELRTSLLYYREKLEGRGLSRAYLRVVGLGTEAVASIFDEPQEIAEVDWIDPGKVLEVDDRLTGDQGARTLQRLAPALGASLGREAS